MKFSIEKMVYGGEGLSRVDGQIVLTPFVLPGELVEGEIGASRQKVARARVSSVEEASPDRAVPRCPFFARCGGCHYQHSTYEAQLNFKRQILSETLRRTGKIEYDVERIETVPSEPYGYRNRAQFHFENGRLGYREMHSRKLVAVDQCPISSPRINEILASLSRMVKDSRWPRFAGSLEVFTDETQVQWNLRESDKPVAKRFFDWLADEIPGAVDGALNYEVGPHRFRVSGPSFFQVNRGLVSRLASLALGDAAGEAAWDLYAGVGLFSLPLAGRFARVTAVESGRSAVEDLAENARWAGIVVDARTDSVEDFLSDARLAPDFVLADPPRAGLGLKATSDLLRLAPKELVIVACDPATLARDLQSLQGRYRIEKVTLVDLFPQTFHIETIVRLIRRDD